MATNDMLNINGENSASADIWDLVWLEIEMD